jgi:hypothetical protein
MQLSRYIAVASIIAGAVFAADDPLACRAFTTEWAIDPAQNIGEWSHDVGAIDATRAYIVECKLATGHGRFWLKATQLDAQGNAVSEQTADSPLPGGERRWFVIQTQPDERAQSLRVFGGGDAQAVFSGLRAMPFSPRTLGNADFTLPLDRKKRIPLWNEETAALLPTTRAGLIALDPAKGHAQPGSVLAVPSGGWCATSSINYPVPMWSDQFRAETYAQSGTGAVAQVALVWSDDSAQNILRVDTGPEVNVADWRRITMPAAVPPEGAKTVRVALIARGGPVNFDDADLVAEPPQTPSVRVLTNQAGYGEEDPKYAVVMTNLAPNPSPGPAYAVSGANGAQVQKGALQYEGRIVGGGGADWGWYFWRADFSGLKQPGPYTIQATLGQSSASSHPFDVAPDRLFFATAKPCVDFFYVQRCGCDVPGWHKPCHMDDAKLPDGTHRDLTGGWHSAGDYNKLTWEYGDGGVTYALATLLESDPEFCARSNRDEANYEDAMEEAQWGAKYLAKQQMDTGGFYKDIQQGPDRATWMRWAAPDVHTDNVRGTADDPIVMEGEGHSPLAIGAWAKLSVLLGERQTENDYLERAIKAWEYATPNAEGDALLLISTIDLFAVTKDERFRDFARKSTEALLSKSPPEGMLGGGYADSGDIPAAALAHFFIKMPGDPLKSKIRARLRSHIDAIVVEPLNAFGISRQKFGDDGFFFEPTSALGHNYEFLCRAWSAIKVYSVLHDKRALVYALDQINFVLGANPYDLCMMEGVGAVNPPRYHHRYIKIPGRELGKVPGAIPNGFVRDMIGNDRPGFDLSLGGREYPSYRTSEPWLVHNVFYLLAITALHDAQK